MVYQVNIKYIFLYPNLKFVYNENANNNCHLALICQYNLYMYTKGGHKPISKPISIFSIYTKLI